MLELACRPRPRRAGQTWSRRTLTTVVMLTAAVGGSAAADASPTWKPTANLGGWADDYGASRLNVVTRPQDGGTVAAWVQSDGSTNRVVTSTRSAGGSWPTIVTRLSAVGKTAAQPDLASSANGTDIAVWLLDNGSGRRIEASVRRPGGAWQTPVTFGSAGDAADGPRVAIDDQGNAEVLWIGTDGKNRRVEASRLPAGGAWTSPIAISEAGFDASDAYLAAGSAGLVRSVWLRGTRVLTRAHAAGAAWGATDYVADASAVPPEYGSPEVAVAVDPRGETTLAWGGADGLRIRRNTPAAGWLPTVPLAASVKSAEHYPSGPISLKLGPNGRVFAAWCFTNFHLEEHYGYVGADQLYFSERDPVSGRWTTTLLRDPGDRQSNGSPVLATSGSGRVSLTWAGWSDGGGSIEVMSRGSDGRWTNRTIVDYSYVPNIFSYANPVVASDSGGDTTVLWADPIGGTPLVHSSVLDVAGPKLLSLAVPTTLKPMVAGAFSVAPKDTWSSVASTKWTFGDGATGSGAAVKHAYAKAGTFAVTVASTDSVGNATTVTKTIVVK